MSLVVTLDDKYPRLLIINISLQVSRKNKIPCDKKLPSLINRSAAPSSQKFHEIEKREVYVLIPKFTSKLQEKIYLLYITQ